MQTANFADILWAVAVIGGPILLGLILLVSMLRRRRRGAVLRDREGSPVADPADAVNPRDIVSPDYREVR
ncbi:MYXO-CTERM sorting domain-containing protein [Prosthecomicrobium sp. N25]|uniref:MYXO-CTERM sorting domain-containing protein n=1 Tax=Prosthecomicrobium sp. N25 TaxID=3129254 RepID=UPI00307849AC